MHDVTMGITKYTCVGLHYSIVDSLKANNDSKKLTWR